METQKLKTNISCSYYITVTHSDRHFHLHSCRNQEESQLFVFRNLAITHQPYTTSVSQPGRETEQLPLLSGM